METEKLIELQLIGQQIEQVQEYLKNMDQQIEAVMNVIAALDDIKQAKPQEETLIPLTNGIFMKGKVTDAEHLLVNVGSNVIVKKTIDETKTLLANQKEEIERYKKEAAEQFKELLSRFTTLEEEYNASRG